MQLVDEDVHVGQLLEDLFRSANAEQVGMEEASLNLNSGEDGVRGLGMVHEVCEIMEELSTVPDSMAAHGDLNAKEDTGNNDEGLVADDHDDVASLSSTPSRTMPTLTQRCQIFNASSNTLVDERVHGAWSVKQVCQQTIGIAS
jgi:hypothetical protein